MNKGNANPEAFGKTTSNEQVHRVVLEDGGLIAKVMTYGASIQDLRLVGHASPLVLGFKDFVPYLTEGRYFGATVGRFANRISKGKITIDGKTYQLDQNSDGVNTLHGGTLGISQRVWEIADLGKSHVTLTCHDPDMAMGFPGNCEHVCTYALKDDGVLEVSYTTTTDATTVVGLAHHSYFILDNSGGCLKHTMQIDADHYLPVNEQLIPTGEIKSVEGTAYDFRAPKPIDTDLKDNIIYDHNFCLTPSRSTMRDVAKVQSQQSGVSMTVSSTEAGIQFYAAHALSTQTKGLHNSPYKGFSGFCMETQVWPDAPNQPDFPNSILQPGETLQQTTRYKFEKN